MREYNFIFSEMIPHTYFLTIKKTYSLSKFRSFLKVHLWNGGAPTQETIFAIVSNWPAKNAHRIESRPFPKKKNNIAII